VQEPLVNRGDFVQFRDSHAAFQSLVHHEQPRIGDSVEHFANLRITVIREPRQVEVREPEFRTADGFENRRLETVGDCHDFARRFHLRAELVSSVHELVERPFREFHGDVVQSRLK
jgi:hypothetical protein